MGRESPNESTPPELRKAPILEEAVHPNFCHRPNSKPNTSHSIRGNRKRRLCLSLKKPSQCEPRSCRPRPRPWHTGPFEPRDAVQLIFGPIELLHNSSASTYCPRSQQR